MLSIPTLTRAFFVYPRTCKCFLNADRHFIAYFKFIEIIEHFIQKLTYKDK